MNKIIAIWIAIWTVLILSACSGTEQTSEVSTETAESSSGIHLNEGHGPAISEGEEPIIDEEAYDEYVQETASAPARLKLKADGTFVMEVVMYDGLPEIRGSFVDSENEFVLSVEESTAMNIDVSELGELRFEKSGMNLIYHGADLGETLEGAVFELVLGD